jgi:hypothetical protein
MTYADYPPVKMDNAITKLFDRRLANWRDKANLPKPPRDTSAIQSYLPRWRARRSG